jgi:hypothetical protein
MLPNLTAASAQNCGGVLNPTANKNNGHALPAAFLKACAFLKKKHNVVLLIIALLCLITIADYAAMGLARRTLLFYMPDTGQELVEERMIAYTGSQETDIIRYVEEVILGPVSLEAEPLLDRGSRLEALLLREDVVYLDLSEEAAIPPPTGRLRDNLITLSEGIRRNFPFVKDICIFVAGNEVFTK